MDVDQVRKLRRLEGRQVHLALSDGSRLDDVTLVSAHGHSLWIFGSGNDSFIPVGDVVDAWEGEPSRSAA